MGQHHDGGDGTPAFVGGGHQARPVNPHPAEPGHATDPQGQPQPAQPPTITLTASMPDPNQVQSIAQGSGGAPGPSGGGSNVAGIAHMGRVQAAATVNTAPPAPGDHHDPVSQGITGVGATGSVDLGGHGDDRRFATGSVLIPAAPGSSGMGQASIENDHGAPGSPQRVDAAGVSVNTGPVPSPHAGLSGASATASVLHQENLGAPHSGVYPVTMTGEAGVTGARGVDAGGCRVSEGHAVVSGTVQASAPVGRDLTVTGGLNATVLAGPDGVAGSGQAFVAISENGGPPRSDAGVGSPRGLQIQANGCVPRMFENQPFSASGTVHVDPRDPDSVTLRNGPSQSVTFDRAEMMTATGLKAGQFDALVHEGARLNVRVEGNDTMHISPQIERAPVRDAEGPRR